MAQGQLRCIEVRGEELGDIPLLNACNRGRQRAAAKVGA